MSALRVVEVFWAKKKKKNLERILRHPKDEFSYYVWGFSYGSSSVVTVHKTNVATVSWKILGNLEMSIIRILPLKPTKIS